MAATVRSLEDRTIARASARLVPFLILCFFVAYLDRVNVGFAALTMNRDLGLSAAAYGFGAGVFFITYSLFEVPSNLLLERMGARRWIARIMLTWGILSGATAFIQGETSFYAVRMLLGIAEAGFFPGIIFYLTLWFPAVYRARIIGAFLAAVPLATVIGAPVSGLLLGFDGVMGLRGWQWLFLLEAVPALILSVVVFFYLTDRPADATWLAPEERAWLVSRLRQEQQKRESVRTYNVVQALCNPKVLALSLVYFGAVANNYGLSFFLPQIVKAFGGSNAQAGLVTAIPYVAGAIGAVWWGRHSDATRERRFHLVAALLLGSIGIAVSTAIDDPVLKIAVLCAAGFGIFGSLPVFWTLPTAFLGGAAAAGGIALINSIGNLAGFVAPFVVGSIKDATGGFTGGLLCVSAASLVAAMIVLVLDHDRSLEHAPDAFLPEADPEAAR
ncbi:MAG TPA: MFS transporter [Vicinamibacterales bacterium]|nr:MFS transporter [Vicinamibacterales bacterium]